MAPTGDEARAHSSDRQRKSVRANIRPSKLIASSDFIVAPEVKIHLINLPRVRHANGRTDLVINFEIFTSMWRPPGR
jgi:hypothetical protein